MRINRHDTNGTKPLLGKGELGYDDYVAGGDVGRVYVGTGSENIALAEKSEIDYHASRIDNPHSVTKAQVGLGNVDNTSDTDKPVSTAVSNALAAKVTKVTSTDNAIVRFNGTTGDIQNSGVTIDDNGNVGIGTNSPSNYAGFNTLTITGEDTSHGGVIELNNSDGSSKVHILNDSANFYVGTVTNTPIVFRIANSEKVRLSNSGNLLVGTSVDNGEKLHVAQNDNGKHGVRISSDKSDGSTVRFVNSDTNGRSYAIGSTGGSSEAGVGFSVYDLSGNSSRLLIPASGNVLVGTTTDNGVDKLQVNGSMSISDLVGSPTSFYQSGTSTAYITDGSNSVRVGTWIWSRVGRTVTASINQLDLESTISGFSYNNLVISGLPFALNSRAIGGIGGSPTGVFTGVNNLLFAGDGNMFSLYLMSKSPTNNTYFHLTKDNILLTSGILGYGASVTYNAII